MDDMNRQGLYIWLKNLVETGKCPGVVWVNKDEKTFLIPWSNQKSRSWQKEDSSVFLEYAKHTCKYKQGDKMDFPKWKQNLKSAINKNRYIERLKGQDRLSGAKPYRVYRFLSESTRKKSDNSSNDFIQDEELDDKFCMLGQNLMVVNGGLSLPARSSYTGSTFSGSGSATSPDPLHMKERGFSFSPDIPRGDDCDQVQGNIPTVVDAFDLISADENPTRSNNSYSLGLYDNSLQNAIPLQQATLASTSTTFITVNNNSNQSILKFDLEETQQDKNQRALLQALPVTLPNFLTGKNVPAADSRYYSSYPQTNEVYSSSTLIKRGRLSSGETLLPKMSYVTPFQKDATMESVKCSAPVQKGGSISAVLHEPGLEYSTLVQESNIYSGKIHSKRFLPSQDSFLSDKTTLFPNFLESNLPGQIVNDRSVFAPQEVPEIPMEFSDNRPKTTTSVPETPLFSIPELGVLESSLDQPSSMDTYDTTASASQQEINTSNSSNVRLSPISKITPNESSIPTPGNQKGTDNSVMHVEVLYGIPHRTVTKETLTKDRCICRLFYGSVKTKVMQDEFKGPQDSEEVELPSVDDMDFNDTVKNNIRMILKDMELGIVISYRNGDIFVERRCLPRVYLSDGVSSSENLTRSTKKRRVEKKIFDFEKFNKSIDDTGTVLKDDFILTIGHEIKKDYSPMRNVPVYVIVRHVEAANKRFKILGASAIAANPMLSDPNSFDKNVVALFKEIDLKK